MSSKKIIQLSRDQFADTNTVLRKISEPIITFDRELKNLVTDLIDTLNEHEIAVGLSAPQIGILKRVFVVNIKKAKGGAPMVFVNPSILTKNSETIIKMEACMSLPGYQGPVSRSTSATVSYHDERGYKKTLEASGFLARVICHEHDHLEGILFIDRMGDLRELATADFFDKETKKE